MCPDSWGKRIKHIHDELAKQANNAMRKSDITMSQVMVLTALTNRLDKTISFKDLEKKLNLAQSTTAGLIKRMEQKGLVICLGDSDDRRIKLVKLTPKGESCHYASKEHMVMTEKSLISCLTKEEQEVFNSMLKKIVDNMK